MCVHGFKGKGYSLAFVENFWKVVERLKSDDTLVQVVADTGEEICTPCPNNTGRMCVEEKKIQKLDAAYAETLEIKTGEVMSWRDAKKRVVARVTDDAFERNCEPCAWKRLGVCKEALVQLRNVVAVLVVALFVAASPARAQKDEDSKLMAIDALEQKILLDKAHRVAGLNKVQTALNKSDFDGALKAAKPLETNVEFKDYYHYLTGQAELGRMKKFVATGKLANAVLAGEQATFHFIQVIGTNPYTTLERRATGLLGETEVALGEIQLKKKQRVKARQYYENGFQRLAQVNLMALVPKASVVSYALLCEKQRSDICMSWVLKLSPLVAKSEEAKLVERIAAFKRPYIERTTSVPYRVDLDAQEFQKGFAAYMAGKYEEAYATWRDMLRDYPRTNYKLRTKFWMGRAAQRSNHPAQAETHYREIIKDTPFAYYSLLASWYGGIDLTRAMDAELPLATNETPLLTPAEVVHIRRAEALIASGVPELALLELQDVRPTLNMPNEFLVYLTVLNHLAGNHLAAFQVFSELSSRNFGGLYSSYGEKIFFPTTRLPLIRDIAKDHRVDPLLVLSIIKQESAFNSEAVSGANAYGLMQIIPPTARDLDPKLDTIELFSPFKNIKLGSKYIGQLLNRYSGNMVLALAAYNAGPGNADRWKRETPPSISTDEMIEHITFKETREYVQNIIRNFYWYNRRVNGEMFPSLLSLTQSVAPEGIPAPPTPAPVAAHEAPIKAAAQVETRE